MLDTRIVALIALATVVGLLEECRKGLRETEVMIDQQQVDFKLSRVVLVVVKKFIHMVKSDDANSVVGKNLCQQDLLSRCYFGYNPNTVTSANFGKFSMLNSVGGSPSWANSFRASSFWCLG